MKNNIKHLPLYTAMILIILASIYIVYKLYCNNTFCSPDCEPEIQRNVYHFRHFQWSGIFPFYGDFIEDPHFACSKLVQAPKSISESLHFANLKFQLVYINPFFQDESSEIILVLKVSNETYLFSLDTNNIHGTGAYAIDSYPEIRLFPYENNKIAVLANIFHTIQGYYIIQYPFVQNTHLKLYNTNTKEFIKITKYFIKTQFDADINYHFCNETNDFISFYLKFKDTCIGLNLKEYYSNNPQARFTIFWNISEDQQQLINNNN